MININKISIQDHTIILQESLDKQIFNFLLKDIESVEIYLSSNKNYEITCNLCINKMAFTFPYNIKINYSEFLDLIDYSNIRNFKAFIRFLADITSNEILKTETLNWLYYNSPLPRDKNYPEDQNLRLSIAELSLLTLNNNIFRKTYKSRIEAFLYSSIGTILFFLGIITGYRQYLDSKVPFYFLFSLAGTALIIFAFIPKKSKQY